MELKKQQIEKSIDYVEDVLENWTMWQTHHNNLTQAMRDILSCVKELTANVAKWEEECDLRGDMWCKLNEENKSLTEENERLKSQKYMAHPDGRIEMIPSIESVRADTVNEMYSMIKERCIKGGIYPAFVASVVTEVAKELLEEE